MSGGSSHNPNGRQAQIGAGWSPLQLQMASYLARAPQAHMASERGVTWHTPTPPHLYHAPAPPSPDPMQGMKVSGAGNSVFRHTATPPDMYRHTPTPPDKHLLRHTPSPGDPKAGPPLPADLYPHLASGRDKMVRPEDILSYARGGVDLTRAGVDLTLGRSSASNGAPISLSVRDAPTINSLIARAQPRHAHSRVDSLLERLAPAPVSPHSVIMHSRAGPTPSPPSSNEDSADSCGAPPGTKRKRKPERVLRLPTTPDPPHQPLPAPTPPPENKAEPSRLSPQKEPSPVPANQPLPVTNGETTHVKANGPDVPEKPDPPEVPRTRRKTSSGSETIDDIAAMIASTDKVDGKAKGLEKLELPMDVDAPVTIDKLKSVLGSPEPPVIEETSPKKAEELPEKPEPPIVCAAAAPRRRSTRLSNSESTNVPVESPSEAKPAEPDASEAKSAEPTAASFVEVENQLEMMFAGIEEQPAEERAEPFETPKGKKRRKSVAAAKAEKKPARRSSRAATVDEAMKKKPGRKRSGVNKPKKKDAGKDVDSGSNASSSRSRGPYIQIRGPRDSPLSVCVVNAPTGGGGGEEESEGTGARRKPGDGDFRNGLRTRGLHCSTLGLRYDATTRDRSWVCAFCERGPHAGDAQHPLGDLFGPYTVTTDCEEFRALDESAKGNYAGDVEVWFHEECGVWAPGVVAAGARVWGLAGAVWGARGSRCARCGGAGAAVACAARGCPARGHVPCARAAAWTIDASSYRALCPRHGAA